KAAGNPRQTPPHQVSHFVISAGLHHGMATTAVLTEVPHMLRKIIVPFDASPQSELAAWKAGALARATSAPVTIVHVYDPPFEAVDGKKVIDVDLLAADRTEHERRAERVADEVTRRFGCRCTVRMLGGKPSVAIVEFAKNADADLIVMT